MYFKGKSSSTNCHKIIRTIVILNVPLEVETADIKLIFEKFGKVQDVYSGSVYPELRNDLFPNQMFVSFYQTESVNRALRYKSISVMKIKLIICEANERYQPTKFDNGTVLFHNQEVIEDYHDYDFASHYRGSESSSGNEIFVTENCTSSSDQKNSASDSVIDCEVTSKFYDDLKCSMENYKIYLDVSNTPTKWNDSKYDFLNVYKKCFEWKTEDQNSSINSTCSDSFTSPITWGDSDLVFFDNNYNYLCAKKSEYTRESEENDRTWSESSSTSSTDSGIWTPTNSIDFDKSLKHIFMRNESTNVVFSDYSSDSNNSFEN